MSRAKFEQIVRIYSDGSLYIGEAYDGIYHGRGKVKDRNRNCYRGCLNNQLPHGNGFMVLNNCVASINQLECAEYMQQIKYTPQVRVLIKSYSAQCIYKNILELLLLYHNQLVKQYLTSNCNIFSIPEWRGGHCQIKFNFSENCSYHKNLGLLQGENFDECQYCTYKMQWISQDIYKQFQSVKLINQRVNILQLGVQVFKYYTMIRSDATVKIIATKDSMIKQCLVIFEAAYYVGEAHQAVLLQGQGCFQSKSGEFFIGNFKNNDYDGYGTHIFQGSRYQGEMQQRRKYGTGTQIYYNTGQVYVGEFGLGSMLSSLHQQFYTGQYKDKQDGFGVLILPHQYIQSFSKNGVFLGSVLMRYKNNCKYVGEYKNGQLQGVGTLNLYGLLSCGKFKNSKLIEYAVNIHPDGSVYEGMFLDGDMKGIFASFTDKLLHIGDWSNDGKNRNGKTIFFSENLIEKSDADKYYSVNILQYKNDYQSISLQEQICALSKYRVKFQIEGLIVENNFKDEINFTDPWTKRKMIFKENTVIGENKIVLASGDILTAIIDRNSSNYIGTLRCRDGSVLKGEWTFDFQVIEKNIYTITYFEGRGSYIGQINQINQHYKKHGTGFYESRLLEISYSGDFNYNKMHGFGVRIENERIYVGSFNDNTFSQGIIYSFKDHLLFRGKYTQNSSTGSIQKYNTTNLQIQRKYIGNILNMKAHGFGIQVDQAKQMTYIGEMSNGKIIGIGIRLGFHSLVRGYFINEKLNGHGIKIIYSHAGKVLCRGFFVNEKIISSTSFDHSESLQFRTYDPQIALFYLAQIRDPPIQIGKFISDEYVIENELNFLSQQIDKIISNNEQNYADISQINQNHESVKISVKYFVDHLSPRINYKQYFQGTLFTKDSDIKQGTFRGNDKFRQHYKGLVIKYNR